MEASVKRVHCTVKYYMCIDRGVPSAHSTGTSAVRKHSDIASFLADNNTAQSICNTTLKAQVCSYDSVITKAIDRSMTESFLLVAATTQPRPPSGFLSCPPLPPGRLGPPSHPTAKNGWV